MTPATFLFVAGQVVACVVLAWACGVFLNRWVDARLGATPVQTLGLPERALLSGLAFLGMVVGFMVAHVMTGGALFGTAGLVPAVGAVLMIAACRKQRPRRPRITKSHLPVILLAVVLVAIFVLPVIVTGSGVRTGDPPWHLGWTEQLLAGESIPTGPAPEFGRNAYPWGFHALLAAMVRLIPGSDPLVAHEALHIFLVALIPLAAACLARLVNRRTGLAAAWLASLVGGFGWVGSTSSSFIASPSEARYGADLVVASPNSMYELFPPALPREVGLVALGAASLVLAYALRTSDRKLQLLAGASMGAVGLVSVPMLLNAAAWSLAMCVLLRRKDRIRSIAVVGGGAIGVFALWAGPVVADYVRYDGFVNITPQLGMEWNLGVALASWGVLLPLAVGGVVMLVVQPRVLSRPVLACVAGSVTLFCLAMARRHLGWGVLGNETLLHQGRMWPPLHLLGAAAAGLGFVAAYGWVRARARSLAVALVAVVSLLGVASPVVASRGLTEILEDHTKGFVYAEPDLVRGSFVRRAASHLSPSDVVSVEGSDELAFLLFQFSGTRLATYDDPRLIGNELRIRFSDLAAQWDRRVLNDGFEPNYIVRVVDAGPLVRAVPLEQGPFEDQLWELVAVDP